MTLPGAMTLRLAGHNFFVCEAGIGASLILAIRIVCNVGY